MKSKALSYLILIIGVFLIINLSRSIFGLLKKGEIITEAQKKLEKVQAENKKLQEELDKVQSQAYIEKQAREKLNLGKTGEVVVILPDISLAPKEEVKGKVLPNWQKWLAVFL